MSKGKKTLKECLEGELLTRIENIWIEAKKYHEKQQGDCIQGRLHCKAVEANLGKLIPDDKKEKELRQASLFVLSAAACLHDIGKIPCNDAEEQKMDHGERSRNIIIKEYECLGLEKGEAIAVADVVRAHNHGRLNELQRETRDIGSEEVNIIELAAIFRLADILETTHSRAPDILSRIMFPDGNEPPKWSARKAVTGWHLDEKNRIILQAVPKKDSLDDVYTMWEMMKEELSRMAFYLAKCGYPYELGGLDIDETFLESESGEEITRARPFPGMAFYDRKYARIFKGRKEEIGTLVSFVRIEPITRLIGESGVGKTSLIHAGLFPRLELTGWKCIWTTPSDNSIEEIKKRIWSEFYRKNIDSKISLFKVMKLAAEEQKPNNLLIVIDQFEDILNCGTQEILGDLASALMAVFSRTAIPNLRVLISFRVEAMTKLNSRILRRITGSARQFPSVELGLLTREGAGEAFLTGLESASIGPDPVQEEGEKELLDVILDDIQKNDDRLYPPYLQMVAETLCRKVDQNNPIITRKMYLEDLEGADSIIARYLMELLKELGSRKEKAERVLIFLISSAGEKVKKSLHELSQETGIDIEELSEIMTKMEDLRMVRRVGDCEFEIIHNHLRKIIDEELVKEEDRRIKFLEEQLNSFYYNYKEYKEEYGDPITFFPVWVDLYKYRKIIKIDEEKYPFILCIALWENVGLGWFWLRELNSRKILMFTKDLIRHRMENISNQASTIFVKKATHEDMDIINEMLKDDEQPVRKAAIEALGKITTHEDKDMILEMLLSEYGDIRKAAVEALGKITTHEDKDMIFKMLHDEYEDVRILAGNILVKIVTLVDKSKITELLKDDEQLIRKAAVEALGKIATHEDRGTIYKIMKTEYGDVRKAAVDALGEIATHEDIDIVIEMLSDNNEDIRKAAEEVFVKIAIHGDIDMIFEMLKESKEDFQMSNERKSEKRPNPARIAAAKAFAKIATHEDMDKVIETLHSGDEDIRKAAEEVFVKITAIRDRNLIKDLLNDEEWFVQRAAAKALEKIATHEDIDTVIELLKCEYGDVRRIAEEIFVKIATHKDLDNVIEKLHHEEWPIRMAAERVFIKIATAEDRNIISEMLHDEEWLIRRAAVDALGKIATIEDRDMIKAMLHDEEWSVQRAAVEALGRIATHEDIDTVTEMLNSEYGDVRRIAEEILVRIATFEDRDKTIKLLQSMYRDVRITAEDILTNTVTDENRDMITKMLKSRHEDARKAAVEALGKIAIHEDMNMIIEMLNDEEESVRKAAVEILGKLETDEDIDAVIEMLQSNYEDIQKAAVGILGKTTTDKGREHILDSLSEKASSSREEQRELLFKVLAELDKAYYCPVVPNSKENKE